MSRKELTRQFKVDLIQIHSNMLTNTTQQIPERRNYHSKEVNHIKFATKVFFAQ